MKRLFTSIFIIMLILNLAVIPSRGEAGIMQKYVNYKGVNIYTEAYNYSPDAREAILFLHGLGGSHSHGEFLYDSSNKYMTITMDYLDHGNSGHVSSMSWDTQIDSIKAVLDAYGIKQVRLVGHSMGADTAMMFAKRYPDNVKKIVLLDRAYYNFKDFEKYNVTKNVMNMLEYDPSSGLSYDEFLQYMNMAWDNDITKTWDVSRNVLLLAADTKNYTGDPSIGVPSLAGIISMIKENPDMFGIDPEKAALFPDMTENNVADLVSFLKNSVANFGRINNKFSVIQTPYSHGDMVRNPEITAAIRDYVIQYFLSE
jgi:pimeloyl-ACP methyl ester carboxylesterase